MGAGAPGKRRSLPATWPWPDWNHFGIHRLCPTACYDREDTGGAGKYKVAHVGQRGAQQEVGGAEHIAELGSKRRTLRGGLMHPGDRTRVAPSPTPSVGELGHSTAPLRSSLHLITLAHKKAASGELCADVFPNPVILCANIGMKTSAYDITSNTIIFNE